MNALEKCLDMLVAVAIMFLIPLLFYGESSRMLHSMSVGTACEVFLKRVSTAGEITMPVWKELEDALQRFGCERFCMWREYTLWEPGEKTGSVIAQCYREENSILLEQMREEGRVSLHKGDTLQLIIYMDDMPTMYYDIVRSEGKAE